MKYDVEINGLSVQAFYSEENIKEIFLPLLWRVKALQEKKGKRILIMLAAPPGAGKSTLVSFLQYLAEKTEGMPAITSIGMDGFHRYQDYLLTHTMLRNGERIPMVKVKGTPETFDLPLLKERIAMVADGKECGWPVYDRLTHNPEENAIIVKGNIVLLEGNYLLLNKDGWNELSRYADYTISITADLEQLRQRLVERKFASMLPGIYEKYGREYSPNTCEGIMKKNKSDSVADIDPAFAEILEKEKTSAAAFVEYSDLYNAKLCLHYGKPADLQLRLLDDDSYDDYSNLSRSAIRDSHTHS